MGDSNFHKPEYKKLQRHYVDRSNFQNPAIAINIGIEDWDSRLCGMSDKYVIYQLRRTWLSDTHA